MRQRKLLIVEDQADFMHDLERIAESTCPGLEIYKAVNEYDAARLIETTRFSVVITDVRLDEAGGTAEGGFKVLDAARKRDPDTQLIVVTSHAQDTHLKRIGRIPGCRYVDRFSAVYRGLLGRELEEASARFVEASVPHRLTVYLPEQGGGKIQYQVDRGMLHTTALGFSLNLPVIKGSAAGIGYLIEPDVRDEQGALLRLVGGVLWDTLFAHHPDLLGALRQAEGTDHRRVFIRIVSSNDALDVPYELLLDSQEFVALRHPVVRALTKPDHVPASWEDLFAVSPTRVLLLAADTCSDRLPGIPSVDDEVEAIRGILARFGSRVEIVAKKSWESSQGLVKELLSQRWHIIHFACHGIHDNAHPDSSRLLYWERDCSEERWLQVRGDPGHARGLRGEVKGVEAGELHTLFGDYPPALVYLSCCHSARAGSPWSLAHSKSLGLADALVRAGVPIVLGHRWPLLDNEDSVKFVATFYERLLSEYPPEQALLWARRSVGARDQTWASSVMVMQTE